MHLVDKDATLRLIVWSKRSEKEHKKALDEVIKLTDNGWEKLGHICFDVPDFYYIKLVKLK